LKILSV